MSMETKGAKLLAMPIAKWRKMSPADASQALVVLGWLEGIFRSQKLPAELDRIGQVVVCLQLTKALYSVAELREQDKQPSTQDGAYITSLQLRLFA